MMSDIRLEPKQKQDSRPLADRNLMTDNMAGRQAKTRWPTKDRKVTL
jgi:hypothetical protein